MILRSNQCILFNEDRINSEIYRKSPLVRGNKLWKQLSSDIQRVKHLSRWNPPGPVIVKQMALLNEGEILSNRPSNQHKPRNLTNAEFTAKGDLANNKTIVIKKADKG